MVKFQEEKYQPGVLCTNVVFMAKCLVSSEFNRAMSAIPPPPSIAKAQEM